MMRLAGLLIASCFTALVWAMATRRAKLVTLLTYLMFLLCAFLIFAAAKGD